MVGWAVAHPAVPALRAGLRQGADLVHGIWRNYSWAAQGGHMGMRIKHLVVDMMNRSFPEFRFFGSPRFFYVFRRESPRGLFDYVKYQRDGKTGALAVDVVTTYDAIWDLYPTGPIGLEYPLVIYKKKGHIETGGLAYLAGEPLLVRDCSKKSGYLESIPKAA
jgi:hypothetical protein